MKVQTPLSRVLIIPHTLSKFFLICSPCLSKKPLTVSIHIPAAVLSKSHTFSRNSLTLLNALNIACRALSAPIPALSNIVPISESLPIRKLIKSSTISASITIMATMPSIFRLANENSFPMPCMSDRKALAPPTILLQFIAMIKAPAIIASNFKAFSIPPNRLMMFFIVSVALLMPFFIEDVNLSIAGCSLFTTACILSNDRRIRLLPSASSRIALANFVAAFTPFVTH